MPDTIETDLRAGTDRMVAGFTALPPDRLRERAERRTRRRRLLGAALSLTALTVLAGVGLTFGADQHHRAVPAAGAAAPSSGPSAVAGSGVTVRLDTPAVYSAQTGNRVRLTVTNPGPARAVVLAFAADGSTPAGWWVLPCDTGAGSCSASNDYSSGPLTMAGVAAPQICRFDLSLPTGTSTYTVWVTPPPAARDFSVTVTSGAAQLAQAMSSPVLTSFLTVAVAGQSSTTLTRGGTAQFTTRIADPTAADYRGMTELVTVTCGTGPSEAVLPADAYTLEWMLDGQPNNLLGATGAPLVYFDLNAGASVLETFRIGLLPTAPADLTSCRATMTVSGSTDAVAPYFDSSQPYVQATVNFAVP